jgi:predicted dehydrogenase
MTHKTLGVCIVGAGDMGTKHAECWQKVGARVVAVVDIHELRAKRLAGTHQLDACYTDYRPAISRPEVTVVSVCVPTWLHAEITVYAANQGKHVLCEKPIALTLTQAEAMLNAARQNEIKLGLGFMRRYSPVLTPLKAWLAQQENRPVMYHAVDIRQIRPKREMHDANANGGPVLDMGVHLYDMWRYLFDSKPVEVFAQGLIIAKDRPELAHISTIAYDTATVTVRYESGDIGSFVVCWGLLPQAPSTDIPDQILGPGGLVQASFKMSYQEARLNQAGVTSEVIAQSNQDMYLLEIDDFAKCIFNDHAPQATGEDGRAALQVALAAIESMRYGRPVSLR